MKKKLIPLFVLALISSAASAKITLPEIIGDHMVLQQNTQVKLWGKAKANTTVSIKASWNAQPVTVKSDAEGRWLASVGTPKASYDARTITLTDGEVLTLKNILIGEVWFCSGQSNMEMPLNGFGNCPTLNANEDIAYAADWKGIRCARIEKTPAATPQETCRGKWAECTPENALWFSATAFHFAKSLNRTLGIPVGIIVCSWGGSKVEGWLPREILQGYDDIDIDHHQGPDYLQPMVMYNGMLKPLQNYTIKGFLWYQGESNVSKHKTYSTRLATMVELWRKEWGLGELPFYFAEIAPFNYGPGEAGALLREAQYKAQALIPNSAMICTNDLVEPYEMNNIHPRNKTDVGRRLSFLALADTYGVKGIVGRGPEYKSMEIKDGKAILSFDYASDGYNRFDGMVGFEVAGADKVFHPATEAKIFNNYQIIVSSDKVSEPVAVRYCFRNFQIGNVAGMRELPMVPFRTDNWE